jgi:hypothetical protein
MCHAQGSLGAIALFAMCSAVTAMGRGNIDTPRARRAASPEAPPILASIGCDLDGASHQVRCVALHPLPMSNLRARRVHEEWPIYARFLPSNLDEDSAARTWSFAAKLQNLLGQPVGTLDGSTVTGIRVFISSIVVTGGTGAITLANPDGAATLTSPSQAFVSYHQIVEPNAYSAHRSWRLSVPNTVTSASITIMICADFPAMQTVAMTPPDTNSPSGLGDDWSSAPGMHHLKRVITLSFKDGTTLSDRQLAIGYVGGAVVGGVQVDSDEGLYEVSIPSDGSDSALEAAIERLESLPQVDFADETAGGVAT